jgi:hypothetical protein
MNQLPPEARECGIESPVDEALAVVAPVVRADHAEFADFCDDFRAGKIGRDRSDRERLLRLVSVAVNEDEKRVRTYLPDPNEAKLRMLLPVGEGVRHRVARAGAAMYCLMIGRHEKSDEVAAAALNLALELRDYSPRG